MGLIENCQNYFATNNLYEVLSIDKNASEAELKKAYKKLSLIIHPDRVPEEQKEAATRKFQVLAQIYFILSDKDKRSIYDETGNIDEETNILEDKDWSAYWRLLFPKIKLEDIKNFLQTYKGSEEEVEDLKNCYLKFKGDMDAMSEHLIGYEFDQEERYHKILKDLIKNKEIPNYSKFSKENIAKRNSRKKRFAAEAMEAEELQKELKINDTDESLLNAIAKRAQTRETQFNDMIKNLESKYVKKNTKKQKV